jgi:DNA-binding CsgD family transcriptional regulator
MKRKNKKPDSENISDFQRIGNIADASLLDACLKINTDENQYVLNLKLEKSHVLDILRSLLKKSFHPSHSPSEIKTNSEQSGTEVTPALWIDENTYLTAREFEIMKLVSDGLYNKEVADRLGLKRATVRAFLNKVNIKFRVNNRMEASNKLRELLNMPNNNQL